MKQLDPVVMLLFVGIVIFTASLIGVDWFFKGEGQVFQVVASIVAGFVGAFFARIKPGGPDGPPPTATA